MEAGYLVLGEWSWWFVPWTLHRNTEYPSPRWPGAWTADQAEGKRIQWIPTLSFPSSLNGTEISRRGCTGSPAHPGWHIHACHRKVCGVSQHSLKSVEGDAKRWAFTRGELDRAVEGQQPRSRTTWKYTGDIKSRYETENSQTYGSLLLAQGLITSFEPFFRWEL